MDTALKTEPDERTKSFPLTGFVITTQHPQMFMTPDTSYRGVAYGTPWPIKEVGVAKTDPISKDLVESVSASIRSHANGDPFPICLITSVELAQRYYKQCNLIGITARTLMLAIPVESPAIDNATLGKISNQSRLIGFDYVSYDLGYSALFEDLTPPFSHDAVLLSSRLNSHGLFNSVSDLNEYIALRWDFVRQAKEQINYIDGLPVRVTALEDNVDLISCGVYEVFGPLQS